MADERSTDKSSRRTPAQQEFERWAAECSDWLKRVGIDQQNAWSIFRDAFHAGRGTPSAIAAPTAGAYRWIEDASRLLKLWLQAAPSAAAEPMDRLMAETDSLLSGVPCPQVDLGFNSPADNAARSSIAPSQERIAVAKMIEFGRLSIRAGVGSGQQVQRDLTDAEEELICRALRNDWQTPSASEPPLLRQWAQEALDDIESWSSYASEYFQDKHNLGDTLRKWRNRADHGPEEVPMDRRDDRG